MNVKSVSVLAGLAALFLAPEVFAHSGHDHGSGFLTGLLHPMLGVDHLLAMVASGLLAYQARDQKALVGIPLVFVLAAGFGAALAATETPFAGFSEAMIVMSLIVLGGAIVSAKAEVWVTAPLVAVFAFFHGFAHVAATGAFQAAFFAGFSTATVVLHAVAISLALALKEHPVIIRWAGASIAAASLAFVV